jgi:pimeloyl-ACP methyl ester carboxylesterase
MNKHSISRTLLAITVLAIASCQTTPKENQNDETPKTTEPMTYVISKDSTRIAFEKVGSGPALIIVSGALSQRSLFDGQIDSLIDMLSKHFTVYTYDRRGRGESTDMQPYAVEKEIDDIESLINIAGGQAFLYGVSSGAALALQATAKLGPSKVQKLAVYEPPYGQGKQTFDKTKQGVDERVKNGQPGDAAAFFLNEIGTPPDAIEGMKASPQWETTKKIDFTLAYDYKILGDGAIPQDIVKTITVPTLVMEGEKTMDFIHATADRIGQLIPGAQRKTLKGQMHQVQADVMAPVLIEFFTK